jgi:UDP-N-acetylglucosamine acyltransferase
VTGAKRIHPTALVDARAELAADVTVGPYAVIGPEVVVGSGTVIGAGVVLSGPTVLGAQNVLHPHVVLGEPAQHMTSPSGARARLEIGGGNTFREFATAHRGSGADGVTRIGNFCFFMAQTHVAHDCVIGSGAQLAGGAHLAGHVEVGEAAILGGLAAVHQFARIGEHAFVAAGAMVSLDVPPYCLATGDRARVHGLNLVGLRRAGIGGDALAALKAAYRLLFRSQLPLRAAIDAVRAEVPQTREVARLVAFCESSERGVSQG